MWSARVVSRVTRRTDGAGAAPGLAQPANEASTAIKVATAARRMEAMARQSTAGPTIAAHATRRRSDDLTSAGAQQKGEGPKPLPLEGTAGSVQRSGAGVR